MTNKLDRLDNLCMGSLSQMYELMRAAKGETGEDEGISEITDLK